MQSKRPVDEALRFRAKHWSRLSLMLPPLPGRRHRDGWCPAFYVKQRLLRRRTSLSADRLIAPR